MLDQLLKGLSDPVVLFGHFTYFLLIMSVLMRRMVALRLFAVASGLTKIIYRAFFMVDPVSVLWETIFVLVNIVQLLLIWYYEHHHRFSDEHQHFAQNMPAGVDRSAIKQLLDLSQPVSYAPDEVLTTEGEKVGNLVYIAEGIVKVEHEGRVVAICGPGDYIGELSFLSGKPATATAIVVKPTTALVFDQAKLTNAVAGNAQLRRTLESALNMNLAGKLVRSNAATNTGVQTA